MGICLTSTTSFILLILVSFTLQVPANNDGRYVLDPDEEMHENGLKC